MTLVKLEIDLTNPDSIKAALKFDEYLNTLVDQGKPAASKPAVSKPAVSKPAVSKPAASKPAASKPAASKPAASKPAASKPAAVEFTTEDVRTKLQEHAKIIGREVTKALLPQFGGAKLADLDPTLYPDLMAKLTADLEEAQTQSDF